MRQFGTSGTDGLKVFDTMISAPLAKNLMRGFEDKDGSVQLRELILTIFIRRAAEIKFIRKKLEQTEFEANEEIYKDMIIALMSEHFPVLSNCMEKFLDDIEVL